MRDNFQPVHGGQLRELAAELGVPEATLVDFSASIHPQPPSDAVVNALCNDIRARKILTSYPDMHYLALKEAIAAYAAVDASAIVIDGGVMQLLGAAVSALRLVSCLVPVPSFAEYRKVLTARGAECRTITVTEETDFALDTAKVAAELKTSGAQAVLLANPQSPSGRLMRAEELLALYEAARTMGAVTIVDEAFIDYAPEESLSSQAAKLPGLIVLRSLTKFFAMPGLRVAYALACPEMRARMEACIPAWPAGSIASEAARMVVRDEASIAATRASNRRERDWLAEQLRLLGLRVFPAAANYLLVKIDGNRNGLVFWRRLIVEQRVVVRSCANFEGLDEHYFRIGVRARADNQLLVKAFAAVLAAIYLLNL
jgi:threonine-phosphate decarboxylase